MKLFQFRKIRNQLTFWFLILSISPLLTSLIVTYYQRVSVIEANTFDKLTAIRDLKVARLTDWLHERKGDLNIMASNDELTNLEFLNQNNSSNQQGQGIINRSREILNQYLKNYSAYNEIFILDAKTATIIVSTKSHLEGEIRESENYFTQTLLTKKLTITDIHYSNYTSEISMTYSVPVFSSSIKEKEIIAILVAQIDLSNSLYAILLDRVGLGETGETLIVNKNVTALNELRWYENAPLNLQIKAEPAVRAANGETGITETTDYRGEPILAAYTYIPETKWGFVCKQDLRELNKPIRDMLLNFLLIFIISGVVVSQIALIISRTITKPILNLSQSAKNMRGGNFSVRSNIKSEDEIGILASEFNNMAVITESKIKVQLGISDISKTMIGKADMSQFSLSLLKRLMKITNANMSTFYILNEETAAFECFESIGANEDMLQSFSAAKPEGEFGNAISTKKIFHVQNISADTVFKYKTTAGDIIPKELIVIPIIVNETVIALISLVNIQKFDIDSLDILKQSWSSINTSYSNLIAGEKTKILAEHLSATNQQLEAQSEELQQQTEELQQQTEELSQTTESLEFQNIELEKQRKQVESANKLKSEFLANMSHELRTPLNSIMALSSVLIMRTKDKQNDEENDYLQIIERNGKRLLALINDILDLSKIEAGKMDVHPKPVSLDRLIQTINENIHSLSEQKGLDLTLDVQDDLPEVETDEQRLHQALLNIVANAVKFTNKGSVDISLSHNKKFAYIEVKDSGIGIAPDLLPHIFDEFRQGDGTASKQYEGTGLGLSIAKKMIDILGGKIEVKSELNIGSVFTVILPLKWQATKKPDKTKKKG